MVVHLYHPLHGLQPVAQAEHSENVNTNCDVITINFPTTLYLHDNLTKLMVIRNIITGSDDLTVCHSGSVKWERKTYNNMYLENRKYVCYPV